VRELLGKDLGPGGRYTISSLVARGGFGAVYRAWDASLQRDVALKVLIPALAYEPAFVERFRREALAVAKLRHRHILEVYDFGEETDGTLYLVMPLIVLLIFWALHRVQHPRHAAGPPDMVTDTAPGTPQE